jgi:hypothetical protein
LPKLEQAVSKEETNFGRKESYFARCQYSGRTFEEVLIFMTLFCPVAAPDRFLHVILLKSLATKKFRPIISAQSLSVHFERTIGTPYSRSKIGLLTSRF